MKEQLCHLVLSMSLILTSTFAWAFKQGALWSDRNHQLNTTAALAPTNPSFVKLSTGDQIGFSADVLDDIGEANRDVDRYHFTDSDFHFDEEQFDRGSRNLQDWRADIVANANIGNFVKARQLLGQSLHSVQDFYAHTNWVERKLTVDRDALLPDLGNSILPQPGIVISSPSCTFDGLAANASLTSGWYAILQERPNDRGWYTNLWVVLQKTLSLPPYWPDDKCIHGNGTGPGLNKDQAARPNFYLAYAYAVKGSRTFFDYVVSDLNDVALCGLLGQESSRKCAHVTTNRLPIAAFSTTALVRTRVTFDASGSTDDGTISRYEWDFGDGTFGEGVSPSHTFTPGTYQVTLRVIDDELASGSTSRAIPIFIPRSDLVPSAVNVSTTNVAPGATMTVTWKITNIGNANAAASTTELRLLDSTDSTIGRPAQKLTSLPTNSLIDGAIITQSQIVTIPAAKEPGSYKIVVIVDSTKILDQIDSTNDAATSAPFKVTAIPKPDLVPSTVSVTPASVVPGATTTASWKITNSGNANAVASTTILRLVSSSDATNGTPANNFMTVATGALAIGASASQSQVITIPASTVPGSYKIVVVADSSGSVGQSNFTNDFGSSGAFTVGTPVTSNQTKISTGNQHTCALTRVGGVKCWGYNGYGQLGDGTAFNSAAPKDVSGLTSGVSAIASSNLHTCALTSVGGVKCWGWNAYGQLGDGTGGNNLVPKDVSGLTSGVSAITSGGFHTCALNSAGSVKCWGYNVSGQLGDGTGGNSLVPKDVSGLTSGISAITSGNQHTCALTSAGGVKCWGYNGYGQLGDGTSGNSLVPKDVSGLTSGVRAIASNQHNTCALTSVGGVKCWGYNNSGELGDGTNIHSPVPKDVSGLTSGISAIAPGYNHGCALTSGGSVKCWGYNGYGQLGDGTKINRLVPIDVSGLTSGVSAISAGGSHTCALTSLGGVKCWGWNAYGELGDGTNIDALVPKDVIGF